MPGVGKSTIGRHLARRLGRSLVDTDAVIENRIGMSIRDYFQAEGEVRFRDIESAVLEELAAGGAAATVIATGGGAVLRDANRRILQQHTACIYLRSTPNELIRRLHRDTKRPLLQVDDPLKRLRDLFAVRDPLYRSASQFVIDTDRPSVPTIVNMLLMQLELSGVVDAASVASPIDASPMSMSMPLPLR